MDGHTQAPEKEDPNLKDSLGLQRTVCITQLTNPPALALRLEVSLFIVFKIYLFIRAGRGRG